MELKHLKDGLTGLGAEHSKAKLREKQERLKELNQIAKHLNIPREYPNALHTHEYSNRIAKVLDEKMEKYSKYVENNLKQANLLSNQIPTLGKLGKKKAANRKNLLGKSAAKNPPKNENDQEADDK